MAEQAASSSALAAAATGHIQVAFFWSLGFGGLYLATFTLLRSHILSAALGKQQQQQQQDWSFTDELADKTVSTLHAVYVTVGTVVWLLAEWPLISTVELKGYGEWPLRHSYLAVTLAYLSFDLVRMLALWRQKPQVPMLVHHIVINIAYTLGILYGYGTFYMGAFVLNEFTTLFLNLRGLLSALDLKSTTTYLVNEALFALSFLIVRVAYNLVVLFDMTSTLPDLWLFRDAREVPVAVFVLLPVLAYAHVALNLYWFGLIVRMFLRKMEALTGGKEASSADRSDNKTTESTGGLQADGVDGKAHRHAE